MTVPFPAPMRNPMRPFPVLAAALVSAAAPAAFADVVGFGDLDFWVGAGANRAAVVIDWGGDADPLAWGFRWDGRATGEDALEALVAADPRLAWEFTDFDFGSRSRFIDAFGYDRDGDGFSPGDPDDSYAAGDAAIATSWFYYTAESSPYAPGADGWGPPPDTPAGFPAGITDRVLTDGAWDGFRFDVYDANFEPQSGPPRQAFAAAAPAAVPEPASVALILGGIGTFAGRRVRRRRAAR